MGRIKKLATSAKLRIGYTTGACACAAARAAVHMLLWQDELNSIEIKIPIGDLVTFDLMRVEKKTTSVLVGVIKDGGDDPDCTHGLEIQCIASWSETPGFTIKGGIGVATVTLPGLEMPVGSAAINPVPRKNILEMSQLELANASHKMQAAGIDLTICVPDGEKCAEHTIHKRLGLIGGISILGTRGTVIPYSTSAFVVGVRKAIHVACVNHLDALILTTGSRTEKAARNLYPKWPEMGLIQAGDFIGVGLRVAKRHKVKQVILVVMIGKMAKMLSGNFMTHVSGQAIDFLHLATLAKDYGCPVSLCEEVKHANTGRHVLELVQQAKIAGFLDFLCEKVAQNGLYHIKDACKITVNLVDFSGRRIATSEGDRCNNR